MKLQINAQNCLHCKVMSTAFDLSFELLVTVSGVEFLPAFSLWLMLAGRMLYGCCVFVESMILFVSGL